MSHKEAFARWFKQATGNEPYPFQICFADGDWLRHAVPVPVVDVSPWSSEGERERV